jgi:hypothetical protein
MIILATIRSFAICCSAAGFGSLSYLGLIE